MVEHYSTQVFPNGFKAQVVANSREAAVRYKVALEEALKAQTAALETHNPTRINTQQLAQVECAVVISSSHNDPPHLKAFANADYHKRSIKRFKLPFDKTDDDDQSLNGKVGIVIVNNMLLTSFDAPIEQVLYLDRVIIAHNLLQTIARVNRVGPAGKDKGFVVDFVGVGHLLKRALDTFAEKEQQEMLGCLSDEAAELAALEQAHADIWAFLQQYGLNDLTDSDAFLICFTTKTFVLSTSNATITSRPALIRCYLAKKP